MAKIHAVRISCIYLLSIYASEIHIEDIYSFLNSTRPLLDPNPVLLWLKYKRGKEPP